MNTPPATRRTVLGAGVAATALGAAAGPAQAVGSTYFRHGVASGDPLPTACVIWTRVTPTDAATPGSGRGPDVRVTWQVSTDRHFRRVVRQGTVTTGAWRDHTVKVDVTGLRPGRWYHYRFRSSGHASRRGRLRTAPAPAATPANLRFGVVSCSNLQAGWFSAYRHLARRDDLHAVLHLGDYLYEYGPGEYGYGQSNRDIRSHRPAREMVSLADYRRRHGQYKQDADLQRLHAKYPWIITWDDHESANDAWRGGAENHQDGEGSWRSRRAAAHRAYDEWMPVRLSGTAALGDGTRLFRRLRFGRLAELTMLDLRSYRSEQVGHGVSPVPDPDAAVSDPDRTITGAGQLSYLRDSLTRPAAQWKLIGNPVMISPIDFGDLPDDLVNPIHDVTGLLPENGLPYNVDQWDGYTADRDRVLGTIRDHGVKDVVFLTGDIHSGWACEVPYDASIYPLGDTAAVEYVCTSVTSNNLKDLTGTPSRTTSLGVEATIRANNRHVKYLDFDSHGFSVLDLTPERTQMDWYVIGDRADRKAGCSWTGSFHTDAGTSRVVPVDRPLEA